MKKKQDLSSLSDPTMKWDFPGWGSAKKIDNFDIPKKANISHLDQPKRHLLGNWKATAICGNDISSSCLYVSALCAAQAGPLAPLILLFVGFVLFLFRKIYAEVGSALPLNGGTYTVLLNTTNKKIAAAAACLTILSYVATAVISATEAIHYLHSILHMIPLTAGTVVLLGSFAFLAIIGIGESAVVALVIFIIHLVTLCLLSISCIYYILHDPHLLIANLSTWRDINVGKALFLGFAAAMLGISGFESSANFIEEQKKGVFPKTLRNMWMVVTVFNPLISFLSLGVLALSDIKLVPPDLLAQMGEKSWNQGMATFISIDAFLVLSGAVLTSFVGVIGLARRMSLDQCLPQFFLKENKFRKTNHWIIIAFFGVCVSILFITGGNISTLAGVYTLSFLCVMALFAIGNMLLKTKRAQLPRNTRASWGVVTAALVFVIIGIVGNIVLNPLNFEIFLGYYFVSSLIIAVMFLRVHILRLILYLVRNFLTKVIKFGRRVSKNVIEVYDRINNVTFVYFTAGDNVATLNNAALYVQQNEQTNKLLVIHIYKDAKEIPEGLATQLSTIDHLYPNLRIDFLAIKGVFSPEMVDAISEKFNIAKNNMFIGTPGNRFPHRVEELGGVRLIL